ncbi:GNAT family N-acetyltransferase [Aliishimia ponticola]|uniref:GNAT family N-acetyltransferase n=2 Tax=Aliishimia ponticola TaxID=2499833 RepID=A0A4S4NDF3_9RHOB|nr:GNAT family N-acetyltransferase [Aliishimia ponticola]
MPRLHSRAEDLSFAGLMIDRGWTVVAERGARIEGFVARDGALIQSLYVAAGARGRGCGSALLERMKREADYLNLWTFEANTGAQRFYERHGFTEVERTSGAGNDEKLPDIRYEWRA